MHNVLVFLGSGFLSAQVASTHLLSDSLKWDGKTFLSQTVEGQIIDGKTIKAPHFDSITFEDAGYDPARSIKEATGPIKINEETQLGIRIRQLVEDTLAHAFGHNGGPPDLGYLQKVFQGKEKGILKGKVKVDANGKETVQYYWDSPADWIASIKKISESGNHLKVSLAIIWVYQDKLSPSRFWAIVKQGWETIDVNGRLLYRDDGFLFLNFDLDGKHRPCNLSVKYRLWFYNYKHADQKSGLKRFQLIERDIRGALDDKADVSINMGHIEGDKWVMDTKMRGLSGVDRGLLNHMTEDLVGGIRQATGE